MRPFLPAEINQIRRIVEAIVPSKCTVQALSMNDGWKVTLVICGTVSCHSYVIDPPLNREAVVRIATSWETGNYAHVADAPRPVMPVQRISGSDDLVRWARQAHHEQRVCYFEGELAQFRQTANAQLRKLHSESDRRSGKTKGWAEKAAQMDKLQQSIELLNTVERLRQGGVVELVQKRKPDGSGAIYFAVRK